MWCDILLLEESLRPMTNPVSDSEAMSVEIQRVSEDESAPTNEALTSWVLSALEGTCRGEVLDEGLPWVGLRLVDGDESKSLNAQWRGKDYPTNVLSFPSEVPGFLGELVLCCPLIVEEAKEQGKALQNHWAHLVVHGVLHLQGFDHETEHAAWTMEQREVLILETLGITNPYEAI